MIAHEGRLWLSQRLSSTVTFLSDARQPEVSFFSLLICLDATKFVWLSVLSLIETICPKVCSKSQLKCAKSSLRIDVRRSKRSLLKLSIIQNFPRIQLFRERLSEKVHATIPKGIVGSFELSLLQRNLKEWHEMLMDVCFANAKGKQQYRRFDSFSVRNSVLIISHITFRYCRVHIFQTTFLEIAV